MKHLRRWSERSPTRHVIPETMKIELPMRFIRGMVLLTGIVGFALPTGVLADGPVKVEKGKGSVKVEVRPFWFLEKKASGSKSKRSDPAKGGTEARPIAQRTPPSGQAIPGTAQTPAAPAVEAATSGGPSLAASTNTSSMPIANNGASDAQSKVVPSAPVVATTNGPVSPPTYAATPKSRNAEEVVQPSVRWPTSYRVDRSADYYYYYYQQQQAYWARMRAMEQGQRQMQMQMMQYQSSTAGELGAMGVYP